MPTQPSIFDESRPPGQVSIHDPWPHDLPWPGKVAAVYGFDPAAVKRAKAMLREVARLVVGNRPDREFLVPVLTTALTVELNDFMRYSQRDQSGGYATPAEKQAATARILTAMQAWDAQVVERGSDAR